MEAFLFQATIYLLAACVAVPLAEFGVVMMLFIIGLELEPRTLWDMRHKLIGLGGLQVSITTALITGATMALGQPLTVALAIGLVFALSSTAIVLQTLNEKSLMQTGGGRSAFSVLLTQDIAVIPMLALIPLLALGSIDNSVDAHGADHGGDHGHEVLSLIDGLPGWGVTLVTIGAIIAVVLAGHYLTRPIFRYIHMAKLREMYTAVSLLFVVGVAVLMNLVGLSPALGTFVAGVVLANSEFRHELEADIEPFKGLLLGLFFITVGAGINFAVFLSAPFLILGLTIGMMLIKALVLYALAIIFKIRKRDKMLFVLSLAQAGEFGFVLISFTVQQNVIPSDIAQGLLLVVALSMLLTPLLFIAYDLFSKRMTDGDPEVEHDEIDEQGTVIIAGVGRFGQVVNRLVSQSGFSTTVLDHDLETIELMRRFGFKGFFGDPTRPDLLHAAGLADAKVLAVCVDNRESALKLVKYARAERPDLHIIARAYDRQHVFQLYQVGANDIVREMFDSSLRAGRYVLENLGLTEFEAHDQETTFYKMDRDGMKDLAMVWDPKRPARDNPDYIEKAKELNRDLETALLTLLNSKRKDETEAAE